MLTLRVGLEQVRRRSNNALANLDRVVVPEVRPQVRGCRPPAWRGGFADGALVESRTGGLTVSPNAEDFKHGTNERWLLGCRCFSCDGARSRWLSHRETGDAPPPDFGKGRRCEGCHCLLSRFNDGSRCALCALPDLDLMRLGDQSYKHEVAAIRRLDDGNLTLPVASTPEPVRRKVGDNPAVTVRCERCNRRSKRTKASALKPCAGCGGYMAAVNRGDWPLPDQEVPQNGRPPSASSQGGGASGDGLLSQSSGAGSEGVHA